MQKTKNHIAHKAPPTNLFGRMCGGFVIGIFITSWISSLLSPLLLGVSLYFECYALAALIVLISAIAYAPGNLHSPWTNAFVNKHHGLYYNSCQIEFEQTPPSKQKVLYAVHPHGAFSLGWACLYTHLADVRFCFAPILFASPFFRLFSRLTGKPGSASKKSMHSYMQKGECIALPPGGFEEATLTDLHQDRVYIRKRTGFIRLCLQYGYAVRPVYVFGERQLYGNVQGAWQWRLAMNQRNLPAILVWGFSWMPWLPKPNVDLRVVAGAPIQLPHIEAPTRQDVALWHGKYVAALTKLFDEYKEEAYGRDAKGLKLEIW